MGVTRCATEHIYDTCKGCLYRRELYTCGHKNAKPGNKMCCWKRRKRHSDMMIPEKCPLKEKTMKKKFDFTQKDVEAFKAFYATQGKANDPTVEKVKEAFDIGDCDTSADVISELLMDDEWSTYKMFEGLASDYLNGNNDVRKGIDCATTALTGWSMKTIAEKVIEAHKEKENSNE